MKRLLILFAVALGIFSALRAADEKKLTVVDYYLLLPDKTFEAPARAWLKHASVIDKQNGYMSIMGDGGQPNFEVALFRYRDGRPLLAVCQGELEGDDSMFLDFYELAADGKMHVVPRDIFPVSHWANADDKEESQTQTWYFELPRHGRTVLVRTLKTKKILHKVTWNGEKFVEEK
jgi:hypothetical protein